MITDSTDSENIITYTTPTVNKQGVTGFNDSVDNRMGKTLTLPASITHIHRDTTLKTITNNSINDAVLQFSYNTDGDLFADATNNAAIYFGDKRYAVIDSSGADEDSIYAIYDIDDNPKKTNNSNGDTGLTNGIAIRKANSDISFNFTAEYMVNISWGNSDNSAGAGIAGFETLGSAIPTADSASFTGRGKGSYGSSVIGDNPSSTSRYFDIAATVDFSNRSVVLESSNTCGAYTASNCGTGSSNLKLEHDFKGTLSYKAGTNAISGTIATKGDNKNFDSDDGTQLTGTANAKFYGPAAEEFGGTFSMQHPSGEGYVGFFGAEKQ